MDIDGARSLAARGGVIPAMPLALDRNRRFDPRYQRALIRYYVSAGASGVAVGVHTTQFTIRDRRHNLFETVLRFSVRTMREEEAKTATGTGSAPQRLFKVAGACGRTAQAVAEAGLARDAGYDAVLLSLGALKDAGVEELIAHCREVAEVMPLVGFYLQPAVGGRVLPYVFWRRLAEIPHLVAVKTAPFNRYATIDVLRAIVDAGREREVFAYTGNDDAIVQDLLSNYTFQTATGPRSIRFIGGLLGQWSVWTHRAVELFRKIDGLHASGAAIPPEIIRTGLELTDANGAFFDADHNFAGSIAGIHTVLHRSGLLPGIWCLDPDETLSAGQAEEIDRVLAAYPHLADEAFISRHIERWLAD